jgi:hypothetical protein
MATKELPKGFACECGEFHEFSSYVYAHWNTTLGCLCRCRRVYEVRMGKAKLIPQKSKADAPGEGGGGTT